MLYLFLIVYCARRRLNLDSAESTPQDMVDLIQVARLAYWQQLRAGQHPAYCFASARNAVQNYFMRQSAAATRGTPLTGHACARRR